MGDRCYLEVYVATVHVERFSQIVFGESAIDAKFEYDDGAMFCADEEANWGLYRELAKAAKAGCIFEGSHGAGSGYGPAMFAAYEGEIIYLHVDSDGEAMVPINDAWLANVEGAPFIRDRDMKYAKRWQEIVAKVDAVTEYLMAKEAEIHEIKCRKVG